MGLQIQTSSLMTFFNVESPHMINCNREKEYLHPSINVNKLANITALNKKNKNNLQMSRLFGVI